MKIGNIELNSRVILGPMAGVTSLPYREFMKEFGVGLSYSEMISDCGISYKNKKTERYCETSKIDRPVGLQIFGSDLRMALNAIEWLEKNEEYDILDLNFGCPVQKVTKTGAGSAWLRRPEEMFEYVRSIVKASSKPVTAKIRLGWDENSINCEHVAHLLDEAGVSMITIHCRTTKQGYSGSARYEEIKGLGERLNAPLCVSGDIFTVEDAKKAMEITKASYVMVARGSLGNPRLITNINRMINGEELLPEPTLNESIEYAKTFSKKMIEYFGERTAIMQLRGLLPYFFKGFPGYKKVRAEISQHLDNSDTLFKMLDSIQNRQHL